ncbi:MAG: peptidoglycan-binding protein [Ilumatobacteraceae bacterium]
MRVPPKKICVAAVVATALMVGTALGGTSVAHAEEGQIPAAILINGRGYGHGRGMSQFGAYGWATTAGWSWQQILDFYYGGPTGNIIAPVDDPGQIMTVALAELNNAQTAVVADANNAIFLQDPIPGRMWTSLVARETSQRVYRVWGSALRKCPASTEDPAAVGFTLIGDFAEVASFTTQVGSDSAAATTSVIGLCEPRSNGKNKIRYYRGEIRAVNKTNNENRTINAVRLDDYVRGVVPRESPASWGAAAGGAGMNALRAQAVAARSYAVTEGNRFPGLSRTCDTQDCQVYGGSALRESVNGAIVPQEYALTDQAVAETAGMVIRTPQGAVVRTEFSSSNGGRTAGTSFPVNFDSGDLASDPVNSLLVWTRVLSAAELVAKYPQIGTLTSVVTTHDGLGGDWNGYAVSVAINGTTGSKTLSGWDFKSAFDLPAPWYETTPVFGASFEAAPVGSMLFIGDSVGESIAREFAAVVTSAYPGINFQALTNRCMVGPSCVPTSIGLPDALSVINSLTPEQFPRIAVIELGYNDDPNSFQSDVDQVVNALNARGVQRIIFVNLSTRRGSTNYSLSNVVLGSAAMTYPNVSVLDWNSASSAATQWRWFRDDVHLLPTGQAEFTLFLRAQLDALRNAGLITSGSSNVLPLGVPLIKGNRGNVVKTLQTKLNTYLKLPKRKRLSVDGQFGTGTVTAVRKVETANGLPVDGIADQDVLAIIGMDSNRIVLSSGTRHSTVATAQTALARVLKVKVRADGIYGSGTTTLVKRFQKSVGLKITGNINRITWLALLAAAAQS